MELIGLNDEASRFSAGLSLLCIRFQSLASSLSFQQVNVLSCASPGHKVKAANLCGIHEVPCGSSVYDRYMQSNPYTQFQNFKKINN